MSACCATSDDSNANPPSVHRGAAPCPRCQRIGKAVSMLTIKHQVKPGFAASGKCGDFRFCASAECPVVYYSPGGATVLVDEVRQPVTQKTRDNPPLCYCFGYDDAMVREELHRTGGCTIAERVAAEVKAGHCACEVRNPQGSCCLGNIKASVTRATAARFPNPKQ